MSTRVKGKKSDPFPVPPEGLYQAVCVDVWDIWTEKNHFDPEKLQDKTRLVFEINKVCKEAPLVGQPFQVSQIYTASMHEKANLRKVVESWRGKKLTEEQALDFELDVLLGHNCQIQVVHHISSNGNTYANIAAIVPLAKGMVKMRPSPDFVRKKDRDQQAKAATKHANQVAPSGDDDEWGPPSEGPGDEDDDQVPF
jgi:hypothetical protein